MSTRIGVIDLFAGPGGLGEGFASFCHRDHHPFRIGISVEKEASAHRTLQLRAFLRSYRRLHGSLPSRFVDFHAGLIPQPDWQQIEPAAWQAATDEAQRLELGLDATSSVLDLAIKRIQRKYDDTILIGGPPCQAYSVIGRVRSRAEDGYVPEADRRHYLFREYIRVLDRLRPAVFVMENVRGMLSSTVESRLVFEMLMEDLSSVGSHRGYAYELRAIWTDGGKARLAEAVDPKDFIVRAEEFGVPQRRHRVIIIGVRSDLAARAERAAIALPDEERRLVDVIGALPRLRSGLTRTEDTPNAWRTAVTAAARKLMKIAAQHGDTIIQAELVNVASNLPFPTAPRTSTALRHGYGLNGDHLAQWLERKELRGVAQHETRAHMASDLERYLFASAFGRAHRYSPKAAEFPDALRPAHVNWKTGAFNDRFRVQLFHEPATTVTSHISKDGHYFIHPDPMQCRSLTVREAARIQTFPDDYFFLGNRTEQYVQVGNAVPPLLATQIAALIWSLLTNP